MTLSTAVSAEWLNGAFDTQTAGQAAIYCPGNSKGFEVKVGMHQGSALSPLLFVIVMEATSTELPCHGNCCMLMTWQ